MYTFPSPLPTAYNENYFSKPFFHWVDCADENFVNKFVALGEALSTMKATVGNFEVHESIRKSTLSWIDYNENSSEIYKFLIDKIDRINYHHYGMKLTAMESIQYTRYPIGGHYKYHNDIVFKKEDSSRKLSIIMALSSPDEYKGGDLLICPHGDNPTTIRLKKGDLIAFPSYIPHKVTPVTNGNRITAVSWAYGPKFV